MSNDSQWSDARRLEAWAGEVRVNLIRLAALVAFYGHHLINVYLFRDDPAVTGSFHAAVTALVLAWASEVVMLYYALARRWLPPALPYVVVGWDIMLVTVLLMVSGDARSWLAVLYLLVIATAPLRLSLPIIYLASLGSMAGYLFFLGYLKYWLKLTELQRLSRTNQIIFLLTLGAAGIIGGQMVRQARRLVAGYPVTVEEPAEK